MLVNKCSPAMLRNQSKKRLMSTKETSVRASSRRLKVSKEKYSNRDSLSTDNFMSIRKRIDSKRKCSFCKQTSHTISNCPKRITLTQICNGREYKEYNLKMMFIESMKRGPRSELDTDKKMSLL